MEYTSIKYKYTLKRKLEQIDQDIEELIDKNDIIDIRIKEVNDEILKLQSKIKRLRIKQETNDELIISKKETLQEWNSLTTTDATNVD
jgi:predicted  nucleic acid-binding Zn-ribbon protein